MSSDLREFAHQYIWWLTPDEAIENPNRVIAQVMNLGTLDDWKKLWATYSDEQLADILKNALPGWFTPRRWNFWHLALNLAEDPASVPPLPQRGLPPTHRDGCDV